MNVITSHGADKRLSPAERIEQTRKLNAAIANLRQRLGDVPEEAKIRHLMETLAAQGLLEPKGEAEVKAFLSSDNKEDGPLAALLCLLDGTKARMVQAQLAQARQLFGDKRFELTAIWQERRVSCVGCLPRDATRMKDFLTEHHGKTNLYIGRDPRSDSLGTGRAATSRGIAESLYLGLDFDRPKDATGPWSDWEARMRELETLIKPFGPLHIVRSGGGLQFWFKLQPSTNWAEMDRRAKLFATVAKEIGADPAPCGPHSVLRLFPSINLPNPAKRAGGQRIALAHTVHTDKAGEKEYQPDALAAALRSAFGVDTKGTTVSVEVVGTGRAQRAVADEAPSPELADRALRALPNNGPYDDRNDWVRLGALHKRAGGTLEAWLGWCATWTGGGNPEEDARVWETASVDSHGGGWHNLMDELKKHNPDAYRDLKKAEAKAAFAGEGHQADFDSAAAHVSNPNTGMGGGKRGTSEAHRARALIDQWGVDLFKTPDTKTFMRKDGRCYSLNNEADTNEAIVGPLAKMGLYLRKAAKNDLIERLQAEAQGGETHNVHIRCAELGGVIYVDLANNRNEVVEIGVSGWKVIHGGQVPVRFWRPAGLLPLPHPVHDGKPDGFLERLAKHLNLPPVKKPNDAMDEGVQAWARLLTCLAAWLWPGSGGIPILWVNGPAGSAKTTMARWLKALIDPAVADVPESIDEAEDLMIVAQSHLVTVLDNLTSISPKISNALATISTGASLQKRKQYSDHSVATLRAHRGIILTGIPDGLVSAPDLADRTLKLTLVPLSQRRTAGQLEARWRADHPGLLALLLDMLAGALAAFPAVEQAYAGGDVPRLADAALRGEAAARALGWQGGLCMEALLGGRKQQAQELLENDPLIARLEHMLASTGGFFEGTCTQLLDVLPPAEGPRTAQGLRSALTKLTPTLKEGMGWKVSFTRQAGTGARLVTIDARQATAPLKKRPLGKEFQNGDDV